MRSSNARNGTGLLAALAVAAGSAGCASMPRSQADTATGTAGRIDGDHQPGGENVSAEIRTLVQTYQRGLNEGDVELVKRVYTDDAIFIGQPFPTATGLGKIAALYADFLSKLDFKVEFEILEVELGEVIGFVRTRSVGTIVPKGQQPRGPERNREVFVVKKIDGAWKFHRYIFNPEVER